MRQSHRLLLLWIVRIPPYETKVKIRDQRGEDLNQEAVGDGGRFHVRGRPSPGDEFSPGLPRRRRRWGRSLVPARRR